MIDIHKIKTALNLNYSNYNWKLSEDAISYNDLKWFDEKEKPSEKELEHIYDKWADNYFLVQHIASRKKLYPEIDELVVALWEYFVETQNITNDKIEEIQKKRIQVKMSIPKLTEKPVKIGTNPPVEEDKFV
jgi:hypothetical protein